VNLDEDETKVKTFNVDLDEYVGEKLEISTEKSTRTTRVRRWTPDVEIIKATQKDEIYHWQDIDLGTRVWGRWYDRAVKFEIKLTLEDRDEQKSKSSEIEKDGWYDIEFDSFAEGKYGDTIQVKRKLIYNGGDQGSEVIDQHTSEIKIFYDEGGPY